ncbi:MAG: hypothetical protein K2N73_10925 [Lachnospiraceae bacterium]|nr:hypothetical protein [Lachnospiraceae bacterium]
MNEKYAAEIASQWNVKYNSDRKGCVTKLEIHVVGSGHHQELRFLAESFDTFNQYIIGRIQVISELSEES